MRESGNRWAGESGGKGDGSGRRVVTGSEMTDVDSFFLTLASEWYVVVCSLQLIYEVEEKWVRFVVESRTYKKIIHLNSELHKRAFSSSAPPDSRRRLCNRNADSVKVTVRHQKPSLIFITLTKITSDQLLQVQIHLFFIVYKTFYSPSSFKTSWSSFSSCFVFRKQLKKLSLTAKTANCSDRLKTNQKMVETLFMSYAAT